jgi:hypothetical protein
MSTHKPQPSDRVKQEQKQSKDDLELEVQQYQQTYDRERSITQKIPIVSSCSE